MLVINAINSGNRLQEIAIKILLVEDEEYIAEAIARGLSRDRYTVHICATAEDALDLLRDEAFQLVILDVMLPGMDGCTLCDTMRREKMLTPVLMLTARDTVSDRVRGLDAGADDYLVKPFDYAELLARVRALLRRDKVHRRTEICIADLTIDTTSRTVRRDGKVIALTPREYAVLEVLAREEGRTITREMLQNSVWAGEEVFPNTVDVCIGHLRRKMDRGFLVKLVRTIHGVGYCLSPEPAQYKEQI